MKISINILTWNSEKYIRPCLERCLSQKFSDYETVVIDNNSSDNTIKICSEYSGKIKIIHTGANLGYCGGHNLGIRSSMAEYILVLNPDVYLEENYVANILEYLDINRNFGGAIGKILQYPKNNDVDRVYIDTMGLSILRSRQFIARNYGKLYHNEVFEDRECFGIDGMAAIYRRDMLEEIKINNEYFDEDFFAYCEDQDLSWRCRRAAWKFAYVNNATAWHVRTWKPKSLRYRKEIASDIKRMALRNHYMMIYKNDDIFIFILHFPAIMYRFIKILIFSILFEQKTLLAFWDFIKLIRKNSQKRKHIRTITKVTLKQVLNWYRL